MKALSLQLDTWDSFRAQTGKPGHGGLTFSMHIVQLIGKPHRLELTPDATDGPFDAVFLALHEFASMLQIAKYFKRLKLPLLAVDRRGRGYPLVWCGGQGSFNPLPFADAVDLVVLGDAEDSLPRLLALRNTHADDGKFLDAAASVEGVFVPSVHDERAVILRRGFARDVSITLQPGIVGRQARLEISRGCQKKCSFCGLGWMGPARHNDARRILTTINAIPSVHLQSCDAEGHPEIQYIRERMAAAGQIDTGCTSTLLSNARAQSFFYHDKMFNFGVEGATEGCRKAIGKSELTNNFLLDKMVELFLRNKETGCAGTRLAWHMIAGLPGETPESCQELADTLRRIDDAMFAARVTGQLQIRWQPLFPNPGTPMQWWAAGVGASDWMWSLRRKTSKLFCLNVSHVAGRGDAKNLLTTIISRSDRRGITIVADPKMSIFEAGQITGTSSGELDAAAPLPWSFIQGNYDPRVIKTAYKKLVRYDQSVLGKAPNEAV